MARKEGSGFATATATAIERLLAARIADDAASAAEALRELAAERVTDRCGMEPDVIDELITGAARELEPTPWPAHRAGNYLADVVIEAGDLLRYVEVKAQTKKASIAQLTETDWVRESALVLCRLWEEDEDFRRAVGRDAGWVELLHPLRHVGHWPREDLWLADIAGLTAEATVLGASGENVEGLRRHVRDKRVVLLNQAGVWVGPLAAVPIVADVLRGETLRFQLDHSNKKSLVAVKVSGPSTGVAFTYHLYPHAIGRHKLHGPPLRTSELAVIRAGGR